VTDAISRYYDESLPPSIYGPTPPGPGAYALASVTPNQADIGSPVVTLALVGSGWPAGTIVSGNGPDGSPADLGAGAGWVQVDATHGTLTIDGSTAGPDLYDVPGTWHLSIWRPSPAPNLTNALPFTIRGGLTLTAVTPNTAAVGTPVLLTFTGTGFTRSTVFSYDIEGGGGGTISVGDVGEGGLTGNSVWMTLSAADADALGLFDAATVVHFAASDTGSADTPPVDLTVS
jgi:hypothetical protein